MSELFEVSDPRGYVVVCAIDTWDNHILIARPFMAHPRWIDEMQRAIRRPRIGIFQDTSHETRHVYYGSTKSSANYIKVIVDFEGGERGFVVTAYPTSTPRTGETLIWPINLKS